MYESFFNPIEYDFEMCVNVTISFYFFLIIKTFQADLIVLPVGVDH